MIRAILACVLLSLQLAFCEYEGYEFTGKVVGVADGDTISVLRQGRAEKVRLDGIDCPEKDQPFGTQAKQMASQIAFGKTVTVGVKSRDRYGRFVARVILPDGQDLSRQLVFNGYAWWYRQYAKKDTDLEQLEQGARTARRGLWADPNPIPPWDFRSPTETTAPSPTYTPPAQTQTPSVQTPMTSQGADSTVYITPEGNAYHKAGCRFAKNGIATPLSIAQKNRHPCKVCKP